MLPLMVMEMEAQSFTAQGQGLDTQAQGLVNGQGLGTVVGYEGIVMEPLWSYRNSNNYDHRHRMLQEGGDSNNLISNDIAHHVALTVGYLVGSMGVVQTVGALVVFPVGVKRLGDTHPH